MKKIKLVLYITGHTTKSERAIANLRRLCHNELANNVEVKIVDVLENPQLAEDEKILATPTLVKKLPLPVRRIIGDLSLLDSVLSGLNVTIIGNENGEKNGERK